MGGDAVLAHPWWTRDGLCWEGLVNKVTTLPWRPALSSATDTSAFDDAEKESERDSARRSVESVSSDEVDAELEQCWRELNSFYAGGGAHEILAHL
jgi:hypothetical protein